MYINPIYTTQSCIFFYTPHRMRKHGITVVVIVAGYKSTLQYHGVEIMEMVQTEMLQVCFLLVSLCDFCFLKEQCNKPSPWTPAKELKFAQSLLSGKKLFRDCWTLGIPDYKLLTFQQQKKKQTISSTIYNKEETHARKEDGKTSFFKLGW